MRRYDLIAAAYPTFRPPTPHDGILRPGVYYVGAEHEGGVVLMPVPKEKRMPEEPKSFAEALRSVFYEETPPWE